FSVIDSALFAEQVDSLAGELAGLFNDKSAVKYKSELRKAYADEQKYWLLCKNLEYDKYQLLREFPIFNRGKNRGGFIAESKMNRINPYGMLAYRTIGLWRENAQT